MNTPKSLLCCAIGAALLVSSGCAYVSKEHDNDIACLWGSSQFDLCAYDSQQTRVQALIDAMTLDEKIGQMTQVEKNSIKPGDIAKLSIGSILSGGGGNPEPNSPETWREMVNGFIAEC